MNFTALAFDFGTKSIGCAVGQNITGTAQLLPAFKAKNGIPDWVLVQRCITQWQPDYLIVGLPLNMDGTEQPLTHQARKFANHLQEKFNLPIHWQDERLTTIEAKETIFSNGGYKALKKEKIDGISACLILESWFNSQIGSKHNDANP